MKNPAFIYDGSSLLQNEVYQHHLKEYFSLSTFMVLSHKKKILSNNFGAKLAFGQILKIYYYAFSVKT